jgi:hypothetical protein
MGLEKSAYLEVQPAKPPTSVKGHHDDDFPGDYDASRINSTRGCTEISGKVVEACGMKVIRLGFRETHYKRTLCDLVSRFKNNVDVVVAHAEQSRVPIISEFQPRLFARGHFGFGRSLVNGVPSVFTGGPIYSLVKVGKSITLTQYRRRRGSSRPTQFGGVSCRP